MTEKDREVVERWARVAPQPDALAFGDLVAAYAHAQTGSIIDHETLRVAHHALSRVESTEATRAALAVINNALR